MDAPTKSFSYDRHEVAQKASATLSKRLNKSWRKSVIRSSVNLVLFLIAVLLLLQRSKGSTFAASLIILFIYTQSAFRILKKVALASLIVLLSMKFKNIKDAVLSYYYMKYGISNISLSAPIKAEAINLAEEVLPHILKSVLLFLLKLVVFSLALFILRRTLLRYVAGVSTLKLIAYPFALSIDTLFKTNLTQSLGL